MKLFKSKTASNGDQSTKSNCTCCNTC